MEKLDLQPIHLIKHVDTTCEQFVDTVGEQPINNLAIGVKQVVMGDWLQRQNLYFKGG